MLRRATLARSPAPRDVILETVDFLQKENEQIRSTNIKITREIGEIRRENETLRAEIAAVTGDKSRAEERIETLNKLNRKLQAELQTSSGRIADVQKDKENVRERLLDENRRHVKTIEGLKQEVTRREADLSKLKRDMENIRVKTERATKLKVIYCYLLFINFQVQSELSTKLFQHITRLIHFKLDILIKSQQFKLISSYYACLFTGASGCV